MGLAEPAREGTKPLFGVFPRSRYDSGDTSRDGPLTLEWLFAMPGVYEMTFYTYAVWAALPESRKTVDHCHVPGYGWITYRLARSLPGVDEALGSVGLA
jgi:hypothetical protein